MEKTICYECMGVTKQFNIRASVNVLIKYKEQFGTDYTTDFSSITASPDQAVKVGWRLVWAMAKCADDTIADPDVFRKNLGSDFDLLMAVEQAAELMLRSLGDLIGKADDVSEPTEPTNDVAERLTAAALRCGISIEDLNLISVGFLLRTMDARYQTAETVASDTREATAEEIANFSSMAWGR